MASYGMTVHALGAMAALMLVQLAVLDLTAVRSGKVPGADVPANHEDFLFRASRALGNTNESIAVFVLLVLYGVLSGAAPGALGAAAWCYVAARVGHSLCYWLRLAIPRSICFAAAMLSLVALLVIALVT